MRSTERHPSPNRRGLIIVTTLAIAYVASHFFRASNVTIGAVGADRWQVEILGRASHAGVAPERGISSTMILALALADVKAGGWFGKVVKGKRQGTSNVGPVTGGDGRSAGDATNVVTDYVHVRGESRSHDSKFFKEITKA